jgi:hypothetical protein
MLKIQISRRDADAAAIKPEPVSPVFSQKESRPMFRKFLFAALLVYGVGIVANYDSFIADITKQREPQAADKVAGGIYAALWPTTVDISGVLPGLPNVSLDLSDVDWGKTALMYVFLSYFISLLFVKNAITDAAFKKAKSGDGANSPDECAPLVTSFVWMLSPLTMPLMAVYGIAMKGAARDRQQKV